MSLLCALAGFLGWLYLGLGAGRFWEPLLPEKAPDPTVWPSVDIIVPARDEATVLPESLPSLLRQDYPGVWRILLVDDHSSDGTADVARRLAAEQPERLCVIEAPPLPPGWSGKVAAMQAGVAQSKSDYILFTDADIRQSPFYLRTLVARAVAEHLDMVSRMVRLQTVSLAEKFLIPAFVFFFAMLYPFRRVNDPRSRIAGAAGGTMLVRRMALENAGGLEKIKDALIDDCSLARRIKDFGGDNGALGQIEMTLTHDAVSLRPYPHVHDVTAMIARTAYTQLRHSPALLAATVLGMTLLFIMPVLLPFFASWLPGSLGYLCWLGMTGLYIPTVRFYGLSWVWALTLPAAAVVYVYATIQSAFASWQGCGGQWKGRAQETA